MWDFSIFILKPIFGQEWRFCCSFIVFIIDHWRVNNLVKFCIMKSFFFQVETIIEIKVLSKIWTSVFVFPSNIKHGGHWVQSNKSNVIWTELVSQHCAIETGHIFIFLQDMFLTSNPRNFVLKWCWATWEE